MAQEERWRTTMKRDTAKSFRRVEAEAQSRFDRHREEMQKEAQKVELEMNRRFDSQQKAMQAIDSKLSELVDHLKLST